MIEFYQRQSVYSLSVVIKYLAHPTGGRGSGVFDRDPGGCISLQRKFHCPTPAPSFSISMTLSRLKVAGRHQCSGCCIRFGGIPLIIENAVFSCRGMEACENFLVQVNHDTGMSSNAIVVTF